MNGDGWVDGPGLGTAITMAVLVSYPLQGKEKGFWTRLSEFALPPLLGFDYH